MCVCVCVCGDDHLYHEWMTRVTGYHTCTSGGELSAALLAGDAPSPPLRAAQRGRGRPRGSV